MPRILVLGGSGFVGRHVCEKLARLQWHVTVPTRRSVNARHLLVHPMLTVAEVDVHDPVALSRLMAGHDAVVNLVAILHGKQASFERTHVELPRKLAQACLATGVKRLVHISALGANSQQPETGPSMYLRSKGEGEAVLQAAVALGLQLSVLRPSVIFGAQDKFLNLFARLQQVFPFMPLAGADAKFQPVWVEDVAQAVVQCLQNPRTAGQTYELCGPEVLTLRELVQLAGRLGGARRGLGRPVLGLPMALGRLQAGCMELAPGEPLMSRDNLDSMKVDNIASGKLPGLSMLAIQPASLHAIAPTYLGSTVPGTELLAMRKTASSR